MQSGRAAGPERLRQYSSIYVRVTTGDQERQLQQLRELVHAGVFVLTGAPDAPRTKTRDGDPLTQYILTYRKLLGISRYIGLAQRDRFELSGKSLEEWLNGEGDTSEVLKRNVQTESPEGEEGEDPPTTKSGHHGAGAYRAPPEDSQSRTGTDTVRRTWRGLAHRFQLNCRRTSGPDCDPSRDQRSRTEKKSTLQSSLSASDSRTAPSSRSVAFWRRWTRREPTLFATRFLLTPRRSLQSLKRPEAQ